MVEIVFCAILWLALGLVSMLLWSSVAESFRGTPAKIAAIVSMASLLLGPISIVLWLLSVLVLVVGAALIESFKTAKAAFRGK